MAQKLVADELIEQARKATQLERFDSESFREGLEVFLGDVNECSYTEQGHQRLAGSVVGALATRLKVNAYLERRPELLKRPVERPVFVFGVFDDVGLPPPVSPRPTPGGDGGGEKP